MTRLSARLAAVAVLGLMVQPASAQSAKPGAGPVIEIQDGKITKPGSLYLQCDGNPNNMSAGESLARLVGAVTLLGLFAPPIEAPDPAKRQFGEAGVGACTALIDGERQETNVVRRLPLVLARALHRIEAKDYKGAIADVGLARDQARTAGLDGDPYFARSMAISFDMIEATALARDGDFARARQISLKRIGGGLAYSYYPLLGASDYHAYARPLDPLGLQRLRALSRISFASAGAEAAYLEELGRFAEAAKLREALDKTLDTLTEGEPSSGFKAGAALSYALAGDWAAAERLAATARKNLADRAAEGKPEANPQGTVEALDLYDLLRLAHDGKLVQARRSFAARSQWLAPSFGQMSAANAIFRVGAPAEELTGALAKTPDELWADRQAQTRALDLERDKNNKSLWSLILPYARADAYEDISPLVWNAEKSRLISKKHDEKVDAYAITLFQGGAMTQVDGMLLHAAVVAKARGFDGFQFFMSPRSINIAWVRFGKVGDPNIVPDLFLKADDVIAELRTVIPTPDEAKTRKATRAAAAKRT